MRLSRNLKRAAASLLALQIVVGAVCAPLRAQPSSSAKRSVAPRGPLSAPLLPPPFDPASPEARLAKKLDNWRASMRSPRPITAPAWVLMDPASGRVLAAHNPDRRMFPASTTKTLMALTAIVALGDRGLDKETVIGPNPPQVGESSIGLLQGERFTVRDLLRAAMIKSANDSCVAVAEAVSGSVPAFMKLMNQQARKVGAKHSHFVNPHGLHDPNHYSTARDLALIARAAMKHPFFNEVIATRDTSIHGNGKIPGDRKLVNRNRLLWRWAECDGVKTGYTRQAGRCLVASATRNIQTSTGVQPFQLLCVVLHSKDSWSDSAQLLLHQGFERFRLVDFAQAGQEFGDVNVKGGASSAMAIAPRAIRLPLRNGESGLPQHKLQFLTLQAPVKRGQVVGNIEFLEDGRPVARTALVAREDVPVSTLATAATGGLLRLGIILSAAGGMVLLVIGLRGSRSTSQQQEKRYDTIRPAQQTVSPGQSPSQTFVQKPGAERAGQRGTGASRGQAEQPAVPRQQTAVPEREQRQADRRQSGGRQSGQRQSASGFSRNNPQGIAAQGGAAQRSAPKPSAAERRAKERRAQTDEVRRRIEAIEQARQAGETL